MNSISDAANMNASIFDLEGVSQIPKAFYEGDHQLEKLEFALAIAETRRDHIRSAFLRAQISDLGGNHEEPGT